MKMLLIVALAATVIAYVFYAEHRLRLRGPIVGLIAVLALSYMVPAVGCAIDLHPVSLMTFDLDVISYQYGLCRSASDFSVLE